MAGSLTYRRYTADDGTDYSIKIDESNAESVVAGTNVQMVPIRAGDYPRLPTGFRVRYALAFREDQPATKRKFVVGGTASIAKLFQPGAKITTGNARTKDDATPADVVFIVTAYRGERVNFVPSYQAQDGGLIDGDTSQ